MSVCMKCLYIYATQFVCVVCHAASYIGIYLFAHLLCIALSMSTKNFDVFLTKKLPKTVRWCSNSISKTESINSKMLEHQIGFHHWKISCSSLIYGRIQFISFHMIQFHSSYCCILILQYRFHRVHNEMQYKIIESQAWNSNWNWAVAELAHTQMSWGKTRLIFCVLGMILINF